MEEQETSPKTLSSFAEPKVVVAPRVKPRTRYQNLWENGCAELLISRGLEPNRRGYPDFWFFDEKGALSFVEVKPANVVLKASQQKFLLAVKRLGAKIYTYRPGEGLREIPDLPGTTTPDDEIPVLRRIWMCPLCEEWIPKGTSIFTLRYQKSGGWAHRTCLPTASFSEQGPSVPTPPEREKRVAERVVRTPPPTPPEGRGYRS